MHIMHVIDSLLIGGRERMLVDLANAAARDGHRVSVCITRQGNRMAGALQPEIPVWSLGRRGRFDRSAMARYADLVRREKVDLLHAHGRPSLAFLWMARVAAARLSDVPLRLPLLLHDHHGIEADASVPLWFRLLGPRVASRYVGVYENLRAWAIRAGFPDQRIRIIGNGLDFQRLRQATPLDLRRVFAIPADVRIGVAVGGVRAEKGHHVLLEALAGCRKRDRVVLFLVGAERDAAYAERLRRLRQELGLEHYLRFLGERADVLSLVRGAEFGVIPSISESGPLVLIEYLACGVPFVATRVGDIGARAAALGLPGFVEPNDAGSLAAELDRLLECSPEELRRRGEAGRDVAAAEFDIRRRMPLWYEEYRGLLKEVGWS
jgi:glycosyltransferase involved in cell wall biosynthesis